MTLINKDYRSWFRSLRPRWSNASIYAALLWFIGLFPGRIGYDTVQSIRLIRSGDSTDWWTGWNFKILELLTFQGNSIWLASLISCLVTFFALKFFMFSLPVKRDIAEKVCFIICLSPLFGNFAVTVSHDSFFVSGILLLIGYSYRIWWREQPKTMAILPYIAATFLLTSKSGYPVLVAHTLFLILIRIKITRILGFASFTLGLFLISNLGINKSPIPLEIMPAIADIKCVAQHPEAKISESEWDFLESINRYEKWKEPVSCASMDEALIPLADSKYYQIDRFAFLEHYFSISIKNPAIVIQAHLQRSSEALPPPFFQGPENQVDQNRRNPIGLNTNIALQAGPEVLHPSIDDPSLEVDIKPLKYLESALLLSSFLVNQASWFWGWGGLWLWPALLIPLQFLKCGGLKNLTKLSYPILTNHFFLLLFGPVPAPRYVMSTVFVGMAYSLILIVIWFEKIKSVDKEVIK